MVVGQDLLQSARLLNFPAARGLFVPKPSRRAIKLPQLPLTCWVSSATVRQCVVLVAGMVTQLVTWRLGQDRLLADPHRLSGRVFGLRIQGWPIW